MNDKQTRKMYKKVMATQRKVYNTKVYQYWINGYGELYRARRSKLDTIECKIERLT